jgi:ACS family D-galactonate transporter-like MFS transporter
MNPPATALSTQSSAADRAELTPAKKWGSVALLFSAAVINFIDRGSISVALPLIASELNFSPSAQGTLLSAFFWSYAMMQIPMGWAVDRFDAKWVYAGAFALWSVACGLTGFAETLAALAVVRMILGIGESAYFASSTKLVSDLFKPSARGFPAGLVECGTSFGLAVGTILTAYLCEKYGWRRMFMIIGFSGLMWLIPWSLFIPPRRQRPRAGVSVTGASVGNRGWLTWNRNLLGVCIGFFCYNYRFYLLMTWLPTYLVKDRQMTILGAGLLSALPYWIYSVLQPIGGRLGDVLIRRGFDPSKVRKGLVVFGFLCGLLVVLVPVVPSVSLVFALLIVSSLTGIAVANMLVIQQTCAPPEEIGRWAGVMNFSGNLSGIAAPFITGLLVQRTGSYLVPFTLGALAMIPGVLAYMFVVGKVVPHQPSGQ